VLTKVTVDYNSWVESEQAIELRRTLDPNVVLAEGKLNAFPPCLQGLPLTAMCSLGYKQFKTGRQYMAKMGDWRDDQRMEIELDGVGGVSILVKADVHRSGKPHRSLKETYLDGTNMTLGINFPCYAFENQAETEGFAKMAKRAGYQVIGLPNYVVWHIDTAEKGGKA